MLTVRQYKKTDAQAFHDLNIEWIENYFEIEDEDRHLLCDPDGAIIARGGRILIAETVEDDESIAVGTVALIPGHDQGDDTVEMAKMAVRENLRGQGIGKALLRSVVETAQEMGARQIWLETNTILEAAVALYRQFGFQELAQSEQIETPYCRCNCQMVLEL